VAPRQQLHDHDRPVERPRRRDARIRTRDQDDLGGVQDEEAMQGLQRLERASGTELAEGVAQEDLALAGRLGA
jgi:hypothetical protein